MMFLKNKSEKNYTKLGQKLYDLISSENQVSKKDIKYFQKKVKYLHKHNLLNSDITLTDLDSGKITNYRLLELVLLHNKKEYALILFKYKPKIPLNDNRMYYTLHTLSIGNNMRMLFLFANYVINNKIQIPARISTSTEDMSPLMIFIKNHNTKSVKQFMTIVSLSDRDEDLNTPLMWSIKVMDMEILLLICMYIQKNSYIIEQMRECEKITNQKNTEIKPFGNSRKRLSEIFRRYSSI